MLELNTIADFQALSLPLQAEVQKALRTKDRLEDFLRNLNKKKGEGEKPSDASSWEKCSHCVPEKPGICRHCMAWGYPGWIWREGRDNSDIHPSQINKCSKLLWYSCNGAVDQLEEYVEPKLRMIFDMGHAWHDTVQRYGKSGAWCEPSAYHPETKIDPEAVAFDGTPVLPLAYKYWIRGSADAVIDRYIVPSVPGIGDISIRIVHEYKTINSGGYGKLNRPKPEHKWQATIYSAVFNVPMVVYLYTNKDNCQMADFPVPFDYSIWNEIVKKIERVQYWTEQKQAPPWEETSAITNPPECRECGYRKICCPPGA